MPQIGKSKEKITHDPRVYFLSEIIDQQIIFMYFGIEIEDKKEKESAET